MGTHYGFASNFHRLIFQKFRNPAEREKSIHSELGFTFQNCRGRREKKCFLSEEEEAHSSR